MGVQGPLPALTLLQEAGPQGLGVEPCTLSSPSSRHSVSRFLSHCGRGRDSAPWPCRGPRAHAPEDGGGCPPAERGLPPHHRSQAPICSLVLCRRKERAQLRGQGALGRKLHPSPASVVLIRERGTSKCGRLASSKRVRGICSPFTVARLTVPEVGPARVSVGQRVNKAGPPRRGDTTRPPGQGV